MAKIPTAKSTMKSLVGKERHGDDVETAMIEFAKLHVQAALKEAVKNTKIIAITPPKCNSLGVYYYSDIDRKAILNTYPDSLIK